MSHRAEELAQRFTAFNDDLTAFVQNCSDDDWQKTSPAEQWTVGVVAYHIGAGHYGAIETARMIVAGEPLPNMTMDDLNRMNDQLAEENAGCTKDEVLNILDEKGGAVADFVAALGDEDLDRTAFHPVLGADITTEQYVDMVMVQSSSEHLANMKATIFT
jgi:hypothetical protein